ncbi:M23 family metallopeptidase [Microbulbifer hydrolyticus]|uniref:Murein DD-endopeptidase MepM/ murein hydrolase activator NlpD n=1 Tax=Microbulbifer hydrolyticus TaxID=48074 RepID=A0A6P1TDW0_9GAMM|nr:M23 family metallopeptidase [Microbulbifer hydrolyticus]MBB5212156.1 murein DD-endopeptidase MepM/ murein hydrolase activator NlpD [Microbulbifer hydrolyticus]QHQ39826.1 peptidoglycan DD-metalloendopeptidase family protein [Microbulbifer hydrolyticus]
MKIILVNERGGVSRSFNFGGLSKALLSLCLLGLPVGALWLGANMPASESDVFDARAVKAWNKALRKQQDQIQEADQQAREQLTALTVKLAEMQARLTRLDALGERLTTIAKLDEGEFQFGSVPAVGGPEDPGVSGASELPYQPPEFLEVIGDLSDQIEDRQMQLSTLDSLMARRQLQDEQFIAGRPITRGWMSSRYGYRTDPFSGRRSWHKGVDFAGKNGSDVVSVAAGVVTWAEDRYGYGQLVEINHGNGYKTRYGHNSELKVKLGDVVKKGQIIALMGSSGRSTGPHVHFEVYKNNRPVDPATYIRRTGR